MPFKKIDVYQMIENMRNSDPEFKEAWDSSRTEYYILGQLIKYRKQRGLSQAELAKKAGHKQQLISRIENKTSCPTMKTFCSMIDALELDIVFIPRENNKQLDITDSNV